jgi:uncharacterized protein
MLSPDVRRDFSYIFYGGEPLLNKPLIAHASQQIRAHEKAGKYKNIKPHLAMITNGSLIDDDIIDVIREYRISVGVSMDGVGPTHDAQRIYSNGSGTFQAVLRGIRRLERASAKHGLCWTIGPQNIDSAARDIMWASRRLKTVRAEGIFLNILQTIDGDTFSGVDESVFFEKMHKLYDVLRAHGIREGRLDRYRTSRKKKRDMLLYPYYCAAIGGEQLVMRPDGRLGICHAGLMQDEPQWQRPEAISHFYKDPIYMRWFPRTPVFMKNCYQHCEYFSRCPGGCAYRVENTSRSMYDTCRETCMVERFFIERAIIEDHCT